jgi:hypothetical protein
MDGTAAPSRQLLSVVGSERVGMAGIAGPPKRLDHIVRHEVGWCRTARTEKGCRVRRVCCGQSSEDETAAEHGETETDACDPLPDAIALRHFPPLGQRGD